MSNDEILNRKMEQPKDLRLIVFGSFKQIFLHGYMYKYILTSLMAYYCAPEKKKVNRSLYTCGGLSLAPNQ